jgi:hypothetical protein
MRRHNRTRHSRKRLLLLRQQRRLQIRLAKVPTNSLRMLNRPNRLNSPQPCRTNHQREPILQAATPYGLCSLDFRLREAGEAAVVAVATSRTHSARRHKHRASNNNKDKVSVALASLGAAADGEATRVEADIKMRSRRDRDNPKDNLVPEEAH